MITPVIPIKTEVEVNSSFVGVVVSIKILISSIIYEVQKTTEDGTITVYAYDWEITSSHEKYNSIIQCLDRINERKKYD